MDQKKKTVKKPVAANTDIVNYFDNDYRVILKLCSETKYDNEKPIMTKYEKTQIIGERATQIAYGAEPTITVKPGMSVIDIAVEELKQRKSPFIIKRYIGETVKYYRPEQMEIRF